MEPLVTYAREHPETLNIRLFVDSNEGSPPLPNCPPLQVGRISQGSIERYIGFKDDSRPWWQKFLSKSEKVIPPDRRILFLVCGPEP